MNIQEQVTRIEETANGHAKEELEKLLHDLQEQANAGDVKAYIDSQYVLGYLETGFLFDCLCDK